MALPKETNYHNKIFKTNISDLFYVLIHIIIVDKYHPTQEVFYTRIFKVFIN